MRLLSLIILPHDTWIGRAGHLRTALSTAAILVAVLNPEPGSAASDWNVISSPSSSDSDLRAVRYIASGEAWAVGTHLSDSYENQTLVLHKVGDAWSIVPSPNPEPSCTDGNVQWGGNVLDALAVVTPSDIWAVGHGCYAATTLVEHWNGTSWSIVPSSNPFPEGQNVLVGIGAVSANDIWAVGYTSEAIGAGTLVEHWDGSQWSVVPSPHAGTGGGLTAVAAVSATDVWAVGWYYDEQENASETLIEHWNGSTWEIEPCPSPGSYRNALLSVAVVSADDIWAVGETSSGGGVLTLVEHWNGQNWSVVPSPNVSTVYSSSNILRSVDVVSPNDIWAIGMYQNEGTNVHQHRTLAEHWDGSTWSLVSVPSPGASAELNGIAILPGGGALAVGRFSDYPIDIYDGHYTLPQTLVVGAQDPVAEVGTTPQLIRPELGPPVPNPSAGPVTFSIHLPETNAGGDVQVGIFDVTGRLVRSLSDQRNAAGDLTVTWDGVDSSGRASAGGFYFARLVIGGREAASRSFVIAGR